MSIIEIIEDIWTLTKFALFVSFVLWLTSCSPTAKLRRADKLIKKSGLEWHSDTLYKTLEIPVPEVSIDTIFQPIAGDTVRIHKDRLSIKYVKLPGDSVFIEGECEADTIKLKYYYTVTKTISAPPCEQNFKWWYFLIAIAGGLLIGKLLK